MSVRVYFNSLHYFTLHRVQMQCLEERKKVQLFYEHFGVNFASTDIW